MQMAATELPSPTHLRGKMDIKVIVLTGATLAALATGFAVPAYAAPQVATDGFGRGDGFDDRVTASTRSATASVSGRDFFRDREFFRGFRNERRFDEDD